MKFSNKGIAAVAMREINRMVSRPIYLAITILIPLSCYLLFVSLFHSGVPTKLPVGIVDLDNSSTSRLIARQVDATQQSEIVEKYASFLDARRAMQRGEIYAFVLIPEKFEANMMASRQPEIPFYTESAHYIAGSLLVKDLTVTLGTIAGGVSLKTQQARGIGEREAMASIQPIVTDVNEMGNLWMNYSVYLSTIMLPGMLQLMILLTTIYIVGIELKEKTSRQWLLCADKSVMKAVAGKMLPYTVIFSLMTFLADALMFRYLHFPFEGSMFRMLLAGIVFVAAQQALGIFIIGLVPVLRDSLSVAAVLGTLAISFSGVTFPIEGMMNGIQSWSWAFPLRHYFTIYVSEALTGGGIGAAGGSYLVLISFLILPLCVGMRLKKALIRQNFPTE